MTGRRSAQGSEILINNGFNEVYNMKGGITEWINAGYEVVKQGFSPI
jgi:rhodanese-related sulfurtransferase